MQPVNGYLLVKPNDCDALTAGGLFIPATANAPYSVGLVVEAPDVRYEGGRAVPMPAGPGDSIAYTGDGIAVRDGLVLVYWHSVIAVVEQAQ